MPPAPAKRVTRSRAAATTTADEMNAPPKRVAGVKPAPSRRPTAEVEDPKKIEDTIAGTAAKRPSQTRSTLAPTVTAARRRIKVTPLDVSASEDKAAAEATVDKAATKPSKSSSRGKKEPKIDGATLGDLQEADMADKATKPKTRGRAAAEKNKGDETQTAPKTRGRPKKTTAPEPVEEPQQQPPVRQTRTRAGSGAAATHPTAASTAKATAAIRKKVTFQDLPESDKENQPLGAKKVGSKGKGASAATGIRAKPVRKPAAARGRRTAATADDGAPEEPKPTPLSPKKVTQVAKSSSPGSSDEDELSGAKTPVRDLSQSPKRSAVLAGILSPVKKLNFTTARLPKSPDRPALGPAFISPPRKLPTSPFKDALKESPKRGDGALIFPASGQKSTTTAALSAPTPQAQSVLLQSPKRGAIDSSIFTQSAIKTFKSPAKSTLMQSPPKRPFPAFKPSGAEATPSGAANAPAATGVTHPDNEPGDVAISCSFRASQSPERSTKVHKIGTEELALGPPSGLDFDESVLDIRSPIRVSEPALPSLQSTAEEVESLPVFSAELSPLRLASDVVSALLNQHAVDSSSIGPGEPMLGVATSLESETIEPECTSAVAASLSDVPSFSFRSAHLHDDDDDDDESSEDELQAENTSFWKIPTETPRVAGTNVRPRMSTVNPAATSRNVGFTPLAAKFSSWLAASPDKALSKTSPQRGVFSPLAAQHVPGKVQIGRQSTPQRRSVASRLSVAALTPAGRRSTSSARKSYGSVLAGTPPSPSYFADEMAVKDLEAEAESLHGTRPAEGMEEQEWESHESVNDTQFPQLIEENAPEFVADTVVAGLGDEALPTDASTKTQIHDSQNTATTATDLECLSVEVDDDDDDVAAAEENRPAVLAVDEPPLAVEAESMGGSEELEHEDPRSRHPPAFSMDSSITPPHKSTALPRFVKTVVSKVPLRPEGYISPIKIPKKRSRSLSGGPTPTKKPSLAPWLIPRSNAVTLLSQERDATSPAPDTPGQQSFVVDDFGDSTLDGIDVDEDDENLPPPTPSALMRPTLPTPGRSPLKAVENGVLQGAVVFVDVHTTEGADASGIFVELLTQMGARCVRQWNWNPRASIAGGEVETDNATPGGLAGKVGITHVVYKDGGKRTLEKVRDAGDVVRCVGVGWVLDCERENAWRDEAPYAVDTSLMPRGGSRRRKSMEPRALINMNGSLSAVKGKRSVSAELTSARKADLVATPARADRPRWQASPDETGADHADDSAVGSLDSSFSTPTGVQAAFAVSTTSNTGDAAAFATPTGHVNYDPSNDMSPTTPYYLSQGARLVQQTCPPKQTQKGLFDRDAGNADTRASGVGFPVTGRIEDQPDESVRVRLEAARRKTMNWRPRVASPLGR